MGDISRSDLDDLCLAKELLANPGLAAKISNLLGMPLEKGFALLPAKWAESVQEATRASLRTALNFAVKTLADKPARPSSEWLHKMIVAADGAAAGAFGLPALLVEMPITTTIMLRSIADIARSEGEGIKDIGTRLACLEVFAFGGKSSLEDAAETGYFTVRVALAGAIGDAAKYIAERGLAEEGAPVLVRLIASIASRFGVLVSEKMAAQAVPVIGAAGGALINTLFMNHFQDMARGHFIVRRLERRYDAESVRAMYERN